MKNIFTSTIIAAAAMTITVTAQAQDQTQAAPAQAQTKAPENTDKKTSFNDASTALSNKALGNLFPMYDKQVNQIIRMCNKGKDISGSLKALVSLGVYLGNDIDTDEENVIVRGSKVDVVLYNEICKTIIASFSKPLNSAMSEANFILDYMEAGKGNDLLNGIKILSKVNYRMRTGSELIINPEKLQLWADAGKLQEKDLLTVYKTMQTVGLQSELNEVSVSALINLMKKNQATEIVTAVTSLGSSGWRCEGELDIREQKVIENLISNTYSEDEGSHHTETPVSDSRTSQLD